MCLALGKLPPLYVTGTFENSSRCLISLIIKAKTEQEENAVSPNFELPANIIVMVYDMYDFTFCSFLF